MNLNTNLEQLKYFIRIAETHSFSEAARECGVSQPSISKYISKLDGETQCRLFVQKKRKIYLTDAGQVYLRAAKQMLMLDRKMRDSIRALSSHYCVTTTAAVTAHFGMDVMRACIMPFITLFPDVQLDVLTGTSSEIIKKVDNGIAQMCIACSLDPDEQIEGMTRYPLIRRESMVCVPSFHRLAYHERALGDFPVIDINMLRDEVFILPSKRAGIIHDISQLMLRRADFVPTAVFELSSADIMQHYCRSGLGIMLTSGSISSFRDGICYLRVKDPVYSYFSFYVRQEHKLTDPERCLMALAAAHLIKEGNWHENMAPELLEYIDEFHAME